MDGNLVKRKKQYGKGNKQGGWDSERARPHSRMPPQYVREEDIIHGRRKCLIL
jgi:hypothetical protein